MSIAIEFAIVVGRRMHADMIPNWFVESKLEYGQRQIIASKCDRPLDLFMGKHSYSRRLLAML